MSGQYRTQLRTVSAEQFTEEITWFLPDPQTFYPGDWLVTFDDKNVTAMPFRREVFEILFKAQ